MVFVCPISRCYATALKLRPTLASLWHDLGVCYYFEAKSNEGIVAMDLTQKSLEILKKAVTLDQSSNIYWNALGVVAASKGYFYVIFPMWTSGHYLNF
jgi:superkiller protein 3